MSTRDRIRALTAIAAGKPRYAYCWTHGRAEELGADDGDGHIRMGPNYGPELGYANPSRAAAARERVVNRSDTWVRFVPRWRP